MIVLDTNVVSELMRAEPAPSVRRWMAGQSNAEDLFTTAVSQAEILYGISALPDGQRRAALLALAEQVFDIDFQDRVLPFDTAAARAFGHLAAERRRRGRPSGLLDVQIAAIALSRGASVATRNVADFAGFGPEVVNPWSEGGR